MLKCRRISASILSSETLPVPNVLAMTLTGCATPQERAAKAVAKYGPYCEGLGLKAGSEIFAACVQKEDARASAAADAFNDRMQMRTQRVRIVN